MTEGQFHLISISFSMHRQFNLQGFPKKVARLLVLASQCFQIALPQKKVIHTHFRFIEEKSSTYTTIYFLNK